MGLLIIGIGMALVTDISDQSTNKYQNGVEIPATVQFLHDEDQNAVTSKVEIQIHKSTFYELFEIEIKEDFITFGNATKKENNQYALFMEINDSAPSILRIIASNSGEIDDILGTIIITKQTGIGVFEVNVELEKTSFVKMKNVTNSALDYAAVAVNIALGLIGIMALWLGVMKIAEEAGLIKLIAKVVRPITKFLFPEIPPDHPAIGAMVMNISANMLGLGNAATPFGLKAMEELDSLNPEKGTATNAMCTFLAVNTAGLTLIPATAIAIRAASGSSDPTIIIGTSIFGASCATISGITAAKLFEKFSGGNLNIRDWFKSNIKFIGGFFLLILLMLVLILSGTFSWLFGQIPADSTSIIKYLIQILSVLAIPLIIASFIIYGAIKKVKIYESFVEGAKEGFNIAIKIIPYLVAMLVAIGIFRAGGGMDLLILIMSPITDFIGMPAEVMPMAMMRPLSGSGSIGIMTEIMATHGADSFVGILSSTILGSTETTFYVIAVYFGAVNIRKTRHALAAGLIADVVGILAALFIVTLLFS